MMGSLPTHSKPTKLISMKLSTRIVIIAVVLWVGGCAILGQDLIPTLLGVVIIALLRTVLEKFVDKERE